MKLEILRSTPTSNAINREQPPILFVHGSYCGAWVWQRRFMPYFSQRGYECFAVSLRGHGNSEGTLPWASLGDYVDDLVEAATGRGSSPILVGHSLGGIVVQHALARMTASAAVLMSSLPPSGLTTSMFHMGQHAPEVLWQFALLQLMGPTAVSPLIFRKALLTDATPVEMVIDMMQRMQQESHRVGLDLLMPPRLPTKSGLTPPMLVMGGDADIFVPVSALQETASHFGASINILAGAPHGLMLDEAWWQPSADIILSWLDIKDQARAA